MNPGFEFEVNSDSEDQSRSMCSVTVETGARGGGGGAGSGLTAGEQRGAHCMDFSRILYLSPVSSGTQERDKHEPNHTQNVAQVNWQKHSHTPVVKRTEEHSCKQLRETHTHSQTNGERDRQRQRG